MSRIHFRLAAVALVVLAAACSEGSTGPKPGAVSQSKAVPKLMLAMHDDPFDPRREVVVDTMDFTGSLQAIPCSNETDGAYTELMEMEGLIITRSQVIRDEAGGYHYSSQWMPVGLRGIGVESGAEYRIAERENINFNSSTMRDGSTFRYVIRWSAPDLGTRGTWEVMSHYTVNANGELVRENSEVRVSCTL
jgi:hypothetical protein